MTISSEFSALRAIFNERAAYPAALPIPERLEDEDLPYSFSMDVGTKPLKFTINWNASASWWTLAIYELPAGVVVLEPHPLMYLIDALKQFQYRPAIRGLHIVPFNLTAPKSLIKEGINRLDFGNAVKCWYFWNREEAGGSQ